VKRGPRSDDEPLDNVIYRNAIAAHLLDKMLSVEHRDGWHVFGTRLCLMLDGIERKSIPLAIEELQLLVYDLHLPIV
jgi:hypothetical protein